MPVRFRIKDIRLLNVVFSHDPTVQPDREKGRKPLDVEIACETEYSKKDRNLRVYIDLRSMEEAAFLQFRVRVGGLFELDQDPLEEELSRLTHVNCPAILFPYVREFIADLTRRAGVGPIHLPPANFVEIARKVKDSVQEKSPESSSGGELLDRTFPVRGDR